MAGAALTPRVRMMAICDGVRESQSEPGVFDLKRLRQRIGAVGFPCNPRRLWLFLVLSGPRAGEFPCYFRIVEDETDRTIFYSYITPRPAFGTPQDLFQCRARIQCIFPREGRYTLQIYFFQETGIDVLKGELTFIVEHER